MTDRLYAPASFARLDSRVRSAVRAQPTTFDDDVEVALWPSAAGAASEDDALDAGVDEHPQELDHHPGNVSLFTCPDCGSPVTNARHVRCDGCIAADPAQSPEIRSRRGQAISARKRALANWSDSHPEIAYDPELFRRDILPKLADVKLTEIMEAACCSKGSASDIRRGKWAPHVSTWAALAELVGLAF